MGKTLLLRKGLATAALALFGVTATWADGTALIDADFSTYAGTDGWTAVDKSTKTGNTWTWTSSAFSLGSSGGWKYVNAVKLQSDWYAKHDDYYVSKAVELKAGSTYTLTTSAGKTSGTDGVLTIEVGTSAEDMSTYKSIKTLTPVNTGNLTADETTTFTAETSGTYYFAYHAVSTRDNASDYFYLFKFKVEGDNAGGGTTEPTEPDQPTTKSVFSADFSTQPTDWTILDKSTTTDKTWNWNGYAFYDGSTYNYHAGYRILQSCYDKSGDNDYLISPAIELKKGVKYTAKTASAKEKESATLTLEIGQSNTDISAYKTVGTLTPATTYTDDRFQTFEFTVDNDGTYYLAYHVYEDPSLAADSRQQKTYVFGLDITAEETGTDPTDPDQPEETAVYSTDMAADPSWTSLLNTGASWQWKSYAMAVPTTVNSRGYAPGMQIMPSLWTDNVNSLCVTPSIELKKGYKYTVTTSTGYEYSNAPHLTLEYGTDNTDAASFTSIATLNPTTGTPAEETNTFSVKEDGTYYLGVRMKETTAAQRKAFVLGLKVVGEKSDTPDTPDTPAVTPAAVTDLVATPNFDDETVTLTWTNPTKDADGKDLTEKVGAKIFKNEETEPFVTIQELEGETTTNIFRPEPFDGENTFTVKTFIGEKESEAASVKVDLTKPATPTAVTGLAATPNYDDNTVTLTWTNPTKDTYGRDITAKMSAKIYKGEETEPIKTVDELTGETSTATFAVEPFDGEVVFTVKTFIEDRASEAATIKVDLTKPVVPVVAKELPYSADLTSADAAKEFTTVDANADNITWGTTEGISGVTYNSDAATAAANDWIITPALKFEENKNYSISATFARQGAFDADKMEVYVGDAAKAEGMTLVASYDITDTENLTKAVRFISTAAADKFIGFHIATPNAENGQLSLLSVNVQAIEAATPNAVTGLEGKIDSDKKTVTLTWTNPTKDTEGYDFVEKVGAKIYKDGELVETVDELTGETTTKTLSPEPFSGESLFSVVTFIGENNSTEESVKLNLDDKSGKEVLVKKFDVSSSTKDDWTIISGGNGGAWKYDYSDVFDFNYQRGGAVEDDWLISPSVALSAKDRFVLKYKIKTGRDYDASIELTIGQGNTVYDQSQVVASHPNLKQNGFGDFTSEQFTVPEDGYYNIAYHVTWANYYVDVRGLEIYSIGEPTDPSVSAISQVANKIGFVAYNKANGSLIVPEGSKVAVYSANGAEAMQTVAGSEAISLNSLASGMYIVKVTDAEGNVKSQKIVK